MVRVAVLVGAKWSRFAQGAFPFSVTSLSKSTTAVSAKKTAARAKQVTVPTETVAQTAIFIHAVLASSVCGPPINARIVFKSACDENGFWRITTEFEPSLSRSAESRSLQELTG